MSKPTLLRAVKLTLAALFGVAIVFSLVCTGAVCVGLAHGYRVVKPAAASAPTPAPAPAPRVEYRRLFTNVIGSPAFDRAGRRVAAVVERNGRLEVQIKLKNSAGYKLVRTIPVQADVSGVQWVGDHRLMTARTIDLQDGDYDVIDLKTNRRRTLHYAKAPMATRDGQKIVYTSGWYDTPGAGIAIVVVDLVNDRTTRVAVAGEFNTWVCAQWSADDQYVWIPTRTGHDDAVAYKVQFTKPLTARPLVAKEDESTHTTTWYLDGRRVGANNDAADDEGHEPSDGDGQYYFERRLANGYVTYRFEKQADRYLMVDWATGRRWRAVDAYGIDHADCVPDFEGMWVATPTATEGVVWEQLPWVLGCSQEPLRVGPRRFSRIRGSGGLADVVS